MDPIEALRYHPEESICALMRECHSLFPFIPAWKGDLPLSVLNWIGHCEERGLLTEGEHWRLQKAIKQTECIY